MLATRMNKLVFTLILFALAASTHAQTTYNTRVTYDAAHPTTYVVDFNGYTPGPTTYPDVSASTPVGSVGFDAMPAVNDIEFLGQNNFSFLGPNNLVLYAFNGQPLTDSLLITLPANTFTFGLDLISPSGTVPEPYQLSIYSGDTLLQTIASPSVNNAYTFVGYDSLTSPITSVAIQISNGIGSFTPTIDNFTVAVPEPGTTALMAVGAIGLLAIARRRVRG
jgi:hypothetical protein